MQELKRAKDCIEPYLEYGSVVEEGPVLLVETPTGSYPARRAVSCLVEPRPGDFVLLSFNGEAGCFVLSVLTREESSGSGSDFFFEGNTNLHVRKGSLNISAEEGVSLASERLFMAAKKGEATFKSFSFVGEVVSAQVESIKTVAGKVENIFQRLTERLIDVFRFVKDHEEVQTGSTRYLVETNLTMHSKNAMHVAEEIVTINAEQVHLG